MMRRTTVSIDDDDLETLRDEARREGRSLAAVLAEVVAQGANDARSRRRPTFGVVRTSGGAAVAAAQDEQAPARGRLRS